MKHIEPDRMPKPLRQLWELGEVNSLSPEKLAPFVQVSHQNIYRWFHGTNPIPSHVRLIYEGIRKIRDKYPDPAFEEVKPGFFASDAGWFPPEENAPAIIDDEVPEIIEDAKFRASIRPLFYELQKVASDSEKRIVAALWPGFVEVLGLLNKHGIQIPSR